MDTARPRNTGTTGTADEGISILPLVAYFAMLFLLLIAFLVVGVYMITQPVPPRL